MAFEVFDDVASYYLGMSLLAVFLMPWTIYIFWGMFCGEKKSDIKLAKVDGYGKDMRRVEHRESCLEKYAKKRYLLFIGLWVFFIYMCGQVGNYNTQELASFKPFEILGVEPDAEESVIKRAYRKLAVTYHPDKNPSPEAAAMFIKVSKAYQALTDPVARENMKNTGNPDGNKHKSVTIGLPAFLVAKENALKILLVYFLVMLIVPPVLVFMWWSNKKRFSENGVMHHSLQFYVQCITEHMSSKYLIEVLAVSQEYAILGERNNTQAAEMERKKLYNAVRDEMAKQKFKQEYCIRANLLLHAYLLRVPIPPIFDEDLKLVLLHAHKLLNAMRGICMWRRFFKAAIGCVELSQLISQAMWFQQDPLYQLPYMTKRDLRNSQMKKLKMSTIDGIRTADQAKRQKALDRTPSEWTEINQVLDQLPNIRMEETHCVKDEEGIFAGDVINIQVTLTRLAPDEDATVRKAEAGELMKVAEEKPEDIDDDEGESDSDDFDEEADRRERELLDTLPVADPKKKVKGKGPLAHCPLFPYPKHEDWTIFLMKANKKRGTMRLFDAKKIPALRENEVVDFFIRLDEAGTELFELHAKCDSYVGCDRQLSFKIKIDKMNKRQRDKIDKTIIKAKRQGLDDDEEEQELLDEEGKWYYLGCSSIFELLINVFVLSILAFFIYNFLQQRGYWDKYFQPPLDKVMVYVDPILKKVAPVVSPILTPIWEAFKRMITPPEQEAEEEF